MVLKFMLGWSALSFPVGFSSNSKKEAPIGVPGTFIRSVPTLTGEGINTHTHSNCDFLTIFTRRNVCKTVVPGSIEICSSTSSLAPHWKIQWRCFYSHVVKSKSTPMSTKGAWKKNHFVASLILSSCGIIHSMWLTASIYFVDF